VQPQGQTDNLMDYASGNLLQHYQWEAIQDPGLQLGINWFEDAGEAESLDENCFNSPENASIFNTYYKKLKQLTLFSKVIDYISKETKVSYCFSELNDKDASEIGGALGLTEPFDNNFEIILRDIKTKEKVMTYLNFIGNPDKSKYYKTYSGSILIKMSEINIKTIFHEVNHAAQLIIQLNVGTKADYSNALMEVETRMILFYSAFKMADEQTRINKDKMKTFLESTYGTDYYADLRPLVGDFFQTKTMENSYITEADGLGYSTEEEKYGLVYNYFSNLNAETNNSINDFNILMKDYANWLVASGAYSFDASLFKPNYRLLLLLK
jgi:hypothetical protein